MTTELEAVWQRTHLRVPREDGAYLTRPELGQAVPLAEQNVASLSRASLVAGEFDWRTVREQARTEILGAAAEYTGRILERAAAAIPLDPLIIATGHQPELFHPGVWVKHLAVGLLARQPRVVGLNLIVDNDLLSSTRLRVPGGTREQPSFELLEFDAAQPAQPWEEAAVRDRRLFESFGERATAAMQRWGVSPLVRDFWPRVVEQLAVTDNIAECFTAARVRLEHEWSLGNLELPMSRVCETTAFRRFATHLLMNAERLREVYNQTVSEYRRIHRIRSSAHPVPALQRIAGWCEVPLWLWRRGDHNRSRVFVRQDGSRLWVSTQPDDGGRLAALPMGANDESTQVIDALRELSEQGVRLRSRALTTTLFARLFLSDLFVHGIGGAKYDEITDRLITRFYGLQPPKFLTLSATAWLPFAEPFSTNIDDARRLRQLIRDTQQNAQRHVIDVSETTRRLIVEKQSLIAEQQAAADRFLACQRARERDQSGNRRFHRLRDINSQLAATTQSERLKLMSKLVEIEHQIAANRILKSREFAACLYPPERIHRMLGELRSM